MKTDFEKVCERLKPGTLVIFDWWFIHENDIKPSLYNETDGTWSFIGYSYCEGYMRLGCPICEGYMRFERLGDGKQIQGCFSYPQGAEKRTPIIITDCVMIFLPDELFEI